MFLLFEYIFVFDVENVSVNTSIVNIALIRSCFMHKSAFPHSWTYEKAQK